jgi:riboflavin biosynthesis pyrimidine reductase
MQTEKVRLPHFRYRGIQQECFLDPDDLELVDLNDALRGLHKQFGINSIMVEGGARVISAFLDLRDMGEAPVVDILIVTVAPTIVGSSKAIRATQTLRNVRRRLEAVPGNQMLNLLV